MRNHRDDPARSLRDGQTLYEVELERDNAPNPHLRIAADGTVLRDSRTAVIDTATEAALYSEYPAPAYIPRVKLKDLPASVQRTINKEAAGRYLFAPSRLASAGSSRTRTVLNESLFLPRPPPVKFKLRSHPPASIHLVGKCQKKVFGAVAAAEPVKRLERVVRALNARDAEVDAIFLVVSLEAPAIAPDAVLVIVVRPRHHEIVAARRAAGVRRPVDVHAAD
ncbi:MAG: hypothetical protein Q7S40_16535 [Opitutaceae bacterium]|nr:hypothetical protein [Opitutaceae bacterium]